MRPRNLHIEGFTCFSEPVDIDFAGMEVFVISGPTGAGKTTIIDAICYALYGKIPRGGDVMSWIAHDRDTMRVDLEFEARGSVWRVSRGVNIARKTAKDGSEKKERGNSPVQLERRMADGSWDPLEDRVDAINETIREAVGLDFDGFTRCVLLPQGRFAQFLNPDVPRQRQQILEELLDLRIYNKMMTKANARASECKTRADGHDRRLREDYADATEERLAETRAALAGSRPRREAAAAEHKALGAALAHAETAENARRRQKLHVEAAAERRKEAAAEEKLEADGHAKIVALKKGLEDADSQLKAIVYDAKSHRVLVEARERSRSLDVLRREAADATAAASDETAVVTAEAAARVADGKHLAAREALIAAEELLATSRRADAAAAVRAGLKPGDPCPVCGGKVGKLPKDGKSELAAADKALKAAQEAEAVTQRTATSATQALTRARDLHADAAKRAKERSVAVEEAAAALAAMMTDGVKPETKAIEKALAAIEVLAASRERLMIERDALSTQHEQLSARLAASTDRIKELLTQAAASDAEAAAADAEAKENVAAVGKMAANLGWREIAALVDAKKSPTENLRGVQDEAQRTMDMLTTEIAKLEAAEERITDGIARAAQLRAELAELREKVELYRELGTLLRADNFLTYIIDEAMRVLAGAASEHLATLYPRFSIAAEKGEFMVVDHWQAERRRLAKTLSGGETFVASLALALALSERLPELQQKTAAHLDSLFLDEGFGTLDASTLDTVIEALEGLRSQERLVGIITHVPELAQRIETRIAVTSSPSGSTVVVGA